MLEIKDYIIDEEIKASRNSVAYKGRRVEDDCPVFVKWYYFSDDKKYARNLRTLKNEFEVMNLLSSSNIVKAYNVIESRDGCGLVLEDFGGKSLRDVIKENKIELRVFLRIAIAVTDAVSKVHRNNIVHKDINPGNIIVNALDWTVKLTDFGIATLVSRENSDSIIGEQLEGTLAYISPEQTGRMNRAVDYRTDIYSLGMTFYEVLVGKLPFYAQDKIGWVHNHIAVTPASPLDEKPEIPEVLSRIIMKMLEKNAEDRYQSAEGIKEDLMECLQQEEKSSKIDDFKIAQNDVSGRFQIPEKLYGRENDIELLVNAFDSVAAEDSSQMLLVAGFSGIGKSVLIKEVHRPVVEKRGYFISGKHDQFKRNIPYSAMIQAFQDLIYQLISESEENLTVWKTNLLEALGPNAQVILDVIPELELIIGKQPAVLELGPTEAQARFNLTFRKFIRVFTRKEHPLVIFLDDLQWADSATLNLLIVLMTDPESRDLLLIGAYRDNEVSGTHPFIMMVEEVKRTGLTVNTVMLTPLTEEHVMQLLADSLQTSLAESSSLAQLVMDKTEGNPFFVQEFLKTLLDENLLQFEFESRRWVYDAKEIETKGITDNVVDLMVKRMEKLPGSTQEALQLASCIGNIFDLKTLSLVSEKSISDTTSSIWPAIQAGLLMPMGDSRELLKVSGEITDGLNTTQALKATDKFLHDRVQQAAYAMISEDQKKSAHLKIARLLLENFSSEELEEKIFDVTRQFNEGRELISDGEEKLVLLNLNLKAGKKAKASTAFDSAANYLEIAKEYLPESSWNTHYELTNSVFWELAENNYILTDFKKMEALAQVIQENAIQVLHKLNVYELRILACFAQSQLAESIPIAFDALKLMGIKFPKKPVLPHILLSVMRTKLALRKTPPEALVDLPQVADEAMGVAMRILNGVGPAAYVLKSNYLPLFVLKMMRLSVQYGNSSASLQGIGLYGLIHTSILNDIETGYRLGQAAMRLGEKLENKEFKAPSITVPNAFIMHYKQHIRTAISGNKSQLTAYQAALEAGAMEHAGLALINHSYFVYYGGLDLNRVAEELKQHVELLGQFRQVVTQYIIMISLQNVLNLLGQSNPPFLLNGEAFNEKFFQALIKDGNELALAIAYVYKVILGFMFEEYDLALEYAKEVHKYADGAIGTMNIPVFYTYLSLTYLAKAPKLSGGQRKKYLKLVAGNQKLLKKWAFHGPDNYLNKYQLVEAERARVAGKENLAIEFYEKSITQANKSEFIQEEALANELYGKFRSLRGDINYARLHMTEARRLYQRWGAKAKVKHLEQTYPHLLGQVKASAGGAENFATVTTAAPAPYATISATTTSNIPGNIGGAIDLGTVVKATRTMAGEIKLNRLLETMMEIVMENAGARRGFLFLERDGELNLASRRDMEQKKAETSLSIPLSEIEERGTELAASIVRYVARAKESVVITDAIKDEKFSRDQYIENQKPRSILCSPIINQGRLTGLLYLENNLSAGAFTPKRLEILNMLSSQAAVSLENAALYDNMENKVVERTREVQDILTNVSQGIFTINRDYQLTGGFSGMVPEIFEGIEFVRVSAVQMGELAQNPKLAEYLELLFTSPFINQRMIENANPLQMNDYYYRDENGRDAVKKLSYAFSRIFETDDEGKKTGNVQKLMVVVDDKTNEFELKQELEQKAQEQAGKVEKLYQILQLDPSIFSNFISESNVTLDEVFTKLQELGEESEKNKEILRVIYREVHTLKGNARALNLDSIGKTAHELEDVFDELKENPDGITTELKEKTHEAVSLLKAEIQDGNSLFEKILNMQQSLQTKPKDAMGEFEEWFRTIVEKESIESGKPVDFEFVNELTEPLDDRLLRKLKNPVSHILRNCVSHGIEDGVRRKELNKPEKGRVKLSVSQKNEIIALVCEDDGGGLNAEAIRAKAEAMKLYSAAELEKMSQKDIFRLIFSSGLSTKDTVTDAAGRGVGMDAVKAELKSLNALIAISTKANQYTKFKIRILGG